MSLHEAIRQTTGFFDVLNCDVRNAIYGYMAFGKTRKDPKRFEMRIL